MSFLVRLEGESGELIDEVDEGALLGDVLPRYDDPTYQCLRFIDPDGDTVFNQLQMEQFLMEWERLQSQLRGQEREEIAAAIRKLALRCRDGVHLYLKFYGD
jgi:hypothetical protein